MYTEALILVQDRMYWAKTENWLQKRYMEINTGSEDNNQFRILGYQWRTLHFNDQTRQSTAKIMAGYKKSDPDSVFFMQQANCLAVPCNLLPHLLLSLLRPVSMQLPLERKAKTKAYLRKIIFLFFPIES